jgi:hypothetical protein
MSITGNLRTMPFADLVHWLSASSKTGTLVIEGAEHTKKVFFLEGTVAAVESDNPREMLGYYLVGWGHLDENDLRQAIEIQEQQGVMLGELVVRLGYLTTDEVDYLIRVKTEESIFDLIMWDEGEFRFLDKTLPEKAFLDVQIPIERVLYEGSRQRDERSRALRMVPDAEHVPRRVSDAELEGENEEEERIIAAMDGRTSIEHIALTCRLPQFTVLSFVFRGIQQGNIELAAPSEALASTPGLSHTPFLEAAAEVRECLRRDRLLEALKLLGTFIKKYSGQLQAVEEATVLERELETKLERGPLSPGATITPTAEIRDLVNLTCHPAESFVFSRIDGPCTVEEVLGRIPGPPVQNRVILYSLLQSGFIGVENEPGEEDAAEEAEPA